MPLDIHPKAISHGALYGYLRDKVGAVKASRWLFSGCEALHGMSPLEAMKAGKLEDVEYAAAAFLAGVGDDRPSSRDYEALKVAREAAAKNAREKKYRIEKLHARRSVAADPRCNGQAARNP